MRGNAPLQALRRHVDQIHTHAVSLIMNVAQDGVEEQWPLTIKVCAIAVLYAPFRSSDVGRQPGQIAPGIIIL